MTRRTAAAPYIVLGIVLFSLISLPKNIADEARSFAIGTFSPIWKRSSYQSDEAGLLQLENQNLRAQLESLWGIVDNRLREHLRGRLEGQYLCFPAQVVYRDPASWSSSLWVNAGEEDNEMLGRVVIAKNSPVVSGASLVGVVDYVGKKQSRIRLITDSGLSPSVRAMRGGMQNRELAQLIHTSLSRLQSREDLFVDSEEQKACLGLLGHLETKLGDGSADGYLAKGEIHGSSAPFWRSRGQILRGVGFNYDFGDSEGPAHNLRGGPAPILKEGDLLVTSGLDGVFPPGLLVGSITRVHPLKEGGYAYDIEARPCASSLADLKTLFIIPPLSSD